MEIKTFSYDAAGQLELSRTDKGIDWPVVYLIYNDTTIYVGETTSAANRMSQHLSNPKKQEKNLTHIKIIFDDTFNKSSILDYEQKLIKYFKVDNKFKEVLNANSGQSNSHKYYQREFYTSHFHEIWTELIKQDMVRKTIDEIENNNLFKFSPYTSLTPEQGQIKVDILNDIINKLDNNQKGTMLVKGCAGTGKTILGVSIINELVNAINIDEYEMSAEQKEEPLNAARIKVKNFIQHNRPIKVGYVFPMTGIRSAIEKVFSGCGNNLSSEMVLAPSNVKGQNYDVLIVDESHRLSERRSITSYETFDEVCRYYGMNPVESNQLQWIFKESKYTILFYDKDQSVKSSDITETTFNNTINSLSCNLQTRELASQMRCEGGNSYVDYVKEIMSCKNPRFKQIMNYDFKIYRDVDKMIEKIRNLDYKYKKDGNDNNLCKTVAGFSWKWNTKQGNKTVKDNLDKYNELVNLGKYDIDIDNNHYIWNLTTKNWISRHDSHYTIGCIHTSQGFDLNYVGVIFGKEIDYNPHTEEIIVDSKKYMDGKVKQGCDEETIKKYIINTYTTIMTRGIKGCYVYVCNKRLRDYLEKYIKKAEDS